MASILSIGAWQAATPQSTFDFAEAFIDGSYADLLAGSSWQYRVTADGQYGPPSMLWRIGVQLHPYGSEPVQVENETASRQVALHVRIEWGRETGLETISADGHLLNSMQNQSFEAIAAKHRDWSQMTVIENLRRHGAKYIDDPQDVVRSLPLQGWIPLFGILRVSEIQLNVPAAGKQNVSRFGFLTYWELILTEASGGQRYYVQVEPFGGKVTRMALVPETVRLREIRR